MENTPTQLQEEGSAPAIPAEVETPTQLQPEVPADETAPEQPDPAVEATPEPPAQGPEDLEA